LTKPTMLHDPMDHLADALVEDILATPAEVLLAESTEDHADPRALAAEFARIVTANAWPVGVPEVGVTAPGAPAPDASQSEPMPGLPGWRVGLERLWQNLLAPRGGRLTPWGAPIAAVSFLALVALPAVAACIGKIAPDPVRSSRMAARRRPRGRKPSVHAAFHTAAANRSCFSPRRPAALASLPQPAGTVSGVARRAGPHHPRRHRGRRWLRRQHRSLHNGRRGKKSL